MFYKKQRRIEELERKEQTFVNRIDILGENMKKQERQFLSEKKDLLEKNSILCTKIVLENCISTI